MIHPVILAGGSGTRLWPLSRKMFPKQFAQLLGEESLFQSALLRFSGPGFGRPLVLTRESCRFIASEQMDAIDVEPEAILIEPEERNTAPSVLAAALWIEQRDPNALLLISPSDHFVANCERFRQTILAAGPHAQKGDLITFGVKPDRAETGYGYLQLKTKAEEAQSKPQPLLSFIEKPEKAEAEALLESGCSLWNTGLYLFSVQTLINAYIAHAPGFVEPVRQSVAQTRKDLDFIRLDEAPWNGLDDISFEYAVMEQAENLTVMAYDGLWRDIGEWGAVWRQSGPDEDGVAISGQATAIDCSNALLRSEDRDLQLVGIGLENLVVIANRDGVLVADKTKTQRVREVIQALEEKNASQARAFSWDHKPWGWYESLAQGKRFEVKRMIVKPGGVLSLQSHLNRAEHWIVVAGTARISIEGETRLVTENQSIYVPLGAIHRIENPGKIPLIVIEVQTGSYLGDDDVIRFEDIYARR